MMLNWLRNRMVALVAVLVVVFALTGCSSAAKEVPKAEAAPAAQTQTAKTEPAPAPVDKGAIIKDAAVAYFNALPPNQNMMEAADLKAKVDAKDASIYLVDIRKPEDFAKGHVAGAVNLPFADMGKNIDKLPKDKQIVLMCYSGQTSGQTLAALKLSGFNAISLKGGFPSWEKASFPIQK